MCTGTFMNRRDFIRIAALTGLGLGLSSRQALAQIAMLTPRDAAAVHDARLQDYLDKMRNFERPHPDDVFVDAGELPAAARMRRAPWPHGGWLIGYGFFHLLSFDDALRYSRNMNGSELLPNRKLHSWRRFFIADARSYGFLDDKPLKNLTHAVSRSQVVRIASTGNYLHRGDSFDAYQKIKKSVGNRVELTSGIRSIIKQYRLFLNKAYENGGNFSLASRQVAPPGYSYHGWNDFDVGQAGFGELNFTERLPLPRPTAGWSISGI